VCLPVSERGVGVEDVEFGVVGAEVGTGDRREHPPATIAFKNHGIDGVHVLQQSL